MAGFGRDPVPGMDIEQVIPVAPVTGAWTMIIHNGPRAGTAIPLPPGSLTVGRNDPPAVTVDVDLTDAEIGATPMLSRRHARLTVTDTGVTIDDLGSTNGTFIRATALSPGESRTITPTGERLKFANLEVEIKCDGA